MEITSTSAVRNTDGLARAVSQLRSAGVGVALGDFGTHDTPLGHLVSLPVSRVKLDGSLTNGIRRDTPAAWVITAMTQLAARLRIEVIAEGITSGDQLAILPSLGVPAVQGYLLGLPGPLSRIPAAVDLAAVAQLNLSSIENRPGVGALGMCFSGGFSCSRRSCRWWRACSGMGRHAPNHADISRTQFAFPV